jgi:hypothetical protein
MQVFSIGGGKAKPDLSAAVVVDGGDERLLLNDDYLVALKDLLWTAS